MIDAQAQREGQSKAFDLQLHMQMALHIARRLFDTPPLYAGQIDRYGDQQQQSE